MTFQETQGWSLEKTLKWRRRARTVVAVIAGLMLLGFFVTLVGGMLSQGWDAFGWAVALLGLVMVTQYVAIPLIAVEIFLNVRLHSLGYTEATFTNKIFNAVYLGILLFVAVSLFLV